MMSALYLTHPPSSSCFFSSQIFWYEMYVKVCKYNKYFAVVTFGILNRAHVELVYVFLLSVINLYRMCCSQLFI
jgi:hypothetical protein